MPKPQFALYVMVTHPQIEVLASSLKVRNLRDLYVRQLLPRPSRLQHDVSVALIQCGWTHEVEHVTEEGLSLDLARPTSKHAVEVDGPRHFLREVGSGCLVENGSTRLKSRLLAALGWKVAHVRFDEWDTLETGAAKRLYLEAKLAVFS
mmetsp:Transcript_4546/g.11699  ORF Transcript_4546/g.11699 Transcript_4546/m.11699 type:complete len:149 (+) Transcript_4546:2-448(+)